MLSTSADTIAKEGFTLSEKIYFVQVIIKMLNLINFHDSFRGLIFKLRIDVVDTWEPEVGYHFYHGIHDFYSNYTEGGHFKYSQSPLTPREGDNMDEYANRYDQFRTQVVKEGKLPPHGLVEILAMSNPDFQLRRV